MKDYSEETFLKLNPDRQIKISLDLIYKIENLWVDQKTVEPLLKILRLYLKLISQVESHSKIKASALLISIEDKPSLRKLLNIATAFERRLDLSLKDEAILVKSTDSAKPKSVTQPLYLILDNLRSAHNIGSIFRTADCLGVEHIYLVGYTATPDSISVQKTSMGSEEFVSWSHFEKIEDLIFELKNKNIKLAALETTESSINIENSKTSPGLALFLGNERFGLDQSCLSSMDMILEIPMSGRKNSLNVSNACAVAVFEILRSWKR